VGAGRVDSIDEGDAAFGQRSGLVGDQHVDVTEVLDTHQSFDEHLELA